MDRLEDKLDEIFCHQEKLQERFDVQKKIADHPSMKQQYINQMALAIHEEAVEMLSATQYKDPDFVPFGWKRGQKFDMDNFREEIADLMHFVVNLALVAGMTSKELYDRYVEKNQENHRRIDYGQRYATKKL
jgi:NTP pyrophosphatase (non-canonical NTP hydrolase)